MQKALYFVLLVSSVLICIVSCKSSDSNKDLPFLGRPKMVNGVEQKHQIRQFSFIDQDSVLFSNETLKGKIHIADFFFTRCPSICPKVMQQMLRLQARYKGNDQVQLVSYSLDPKRDTPEQLKSFATSIGADLSMWSFVHGPKDSIMALAVEDYYVPAYEDPDAPGGFDHSGKLLLVDTNGHLRAFAEGTEAESVTDFFEDVDALLAQTK